MTIHDMKKNQIMTHLAPLDSDDEASREGLSGGYSSVAEPSWAKKLLVKVRKTPAEHSGSPV
jgi:hypothetical protein